jgi:hypothetical protein
MPRVQPRQEHSFALFRDRHGYAKDLDAGIHWFAFLNLRLQALPEQGLEVAITVF